MRPGFLISTAAFAFSLGSLAVSSAVLAQQQSAPAAQPATPQPAAAPSQAQLDAAREAYTRGQALFNEGKFPEAKAAFEQAFVAVPNPVVLLSIAECEMRLGNLEASHAALERYLTLRPDAPDRAEVEQKIADLLATPATLVLTSEPPGASVSIDGQSSAKITPVEIQVPRGDHRIDLTLEGYVASSTSVSARIGARHELHVALQPEPPPPPIEAATSATASEAPAAAGEPTTALWITGIVGAAGIVTGTVLGFMTLAERSDYDENPTADSADRGERLALFTDVAFGVGAMALLTGAVIYLTADDTDAEEPAASSAGLRLQPTASAKGAGVIATTRF